jgi:hypothetical protein
MLNETLILGIGLSGIFLGIFLAYLTKEEINPGRRYFIVAKDTLFSLILLIIFYLFVINDLFYLLTVFTIIGAVLFLLHFIKFKKDHHLYVINYAYFIVVYLFIPELLHQAILASLVFVYGLPTGSLLRGKVNE